MNPLWSDILAQGDNIRQVLDHMFGDERDRLSSAAGYIHPQKPVMLIGIASAAYLCWPAQVHLSQAGFVTRIMNAADALYHEWHALRHANVVINSRSGETVEIVKLAERLKNESIPFLAITNEPESTLAQMASLILWANTRKDELVSINVVTGMMLTTLVWAAAVRGQLDQLRPDLEFLPGAMNATIERIRSMDDQFLGYIAGRSPLYLLARGASQGAALCGRLVLEEVARQPSVALEAAEFRQGPNEVIDEQFGGILFIGRGETTALTRWLAKEIQRYKGRVISVGTEDAVEGLPGLTFPLPKVSEVFMPVLEVVPIQGLAYTLAEGKGIEPGTVRYITKVIKQEAVEKN